MKIEYSDLAEAQSCLNVINDLQLRFTNGIQSFGEIKPNEILWYRNDGKNGGGRRFEFLNSSFISSASINVSQVHYELNDKSKITSASALSAIVHPLHSVHPSLHLHISLMTYQNFEYYWRIMADLNPPIPNDCQTEIFEKIFIDLAPEHYKKAFLNGNQYFYIPSLERHRGVLHFYLEKYKSGNFVEDLRFAEKIGINVITTYLSFLNSNKLISKSIDDNEDTRIAYNTLYFFQVVTLDRGTTAGILAHDQNDVGILGSLPNIVNKNLLVSWITILSKPQDLLLERIINSLPNEALIKIDNDLKAKIAQIIRKFYLEFPDALQNQAPMPA